MVGNLITTCGGLVLMFGKTNSVSGLKKKKKSGALPNTIHKNNLKMDWRPKYKTGHYKILRGKHRQSTL